MAAVSHFADRKLTPGATLERQWLLEDWAAADRRCHVLAVDPDADPAAREAATREKQEATDRINVHKSEQATALFLAFSAAMQFSPGLLAAVLDEALGGQMTQLKEENARLRKRLRRAEQVLAGIVEGKAVYS